MKTDPPVKAFDCVAYMRDSRRRISAEISGMSHEGVRRWASSCQPEDTALARLLAHASACRKAWQATPTTRSRGAPVMIGVRQGLNSRDAASGRGQEGAR